MQLVKERAISPAAYLEMEAQSPLKHEYVAGEIYAMVGVSQRHNAIAGNAYLMLRQHLKGKPCLVFMGDVKLGVAQADAFYYPDVMVACREGNPLAGDAPVVDDPVLVIEVLSPSTEATDRREKLQAYRTLPSLREYALVSQDRQQVEVYRREGDIGWLYVVYEPGDMVEFESVGATFPLADLYAGTDIA